MATVSPRFQHRGWLGALSEHAAALMLRLRGHSVVGRRVRVAGVEVDLLTRKGDELALVEVKARGFRSPWLPPERAVTAAQRRRLLRAAQALAASRGRLVRVHVVLVRWTPLPRLTLLRDALADHVGAGDLP